jgi:acetyl-CoA C-acetyltransferase
MGKVFIIDGKRSPIGSFLGSFKNLHPADLGADVLRVLLESNQIPKEKIDEVIVGNILPAGVGQGIGRQVAIKAGVPNDIPAYSLNMACGSGMKAVMNAYSNISVGMHHLVVAGGVESMSFAPYLVTGKTRDGVKMGDLKMVDHMIFDALTDAFTGVHMGITAENIVSQQNISREEQDRFAIESQKKTIYSVDNGVFKDEIIPIKIKDKKTEIVVEHDEYPNRTTSFEKLQTLRPAFKADGTVTAGNASGINDGASFTIVASEEAIKQYNLKPLAEVYGIGQGGVDPQTMGLGPVPAIRNALKHAKLTLKDIDIIELNEAFAAQSIGVINQLAQEHNLTKEEILQRTNVNGGAIALGHPVGASGNRIIVTLLHEMKKRKATYGLASLCIGGGMGTAIILKLI